ncbi:MAG: U32 family peptidase [Akkermansia sp.]|nr:U32 family peptidase [Akkermansia sp.]
MPAQQPEILAPAGNWDCVRAAVANGADAVYFGLDQFNARMRADNFTREDLAVLVPFLHSHGVRAYVTMNVLIFPAEMGEALKYLDALDAAGVDGVIVQDIGLAGLIAQHRREGRWTLELHISTQMTVSSPEAVRLVDEMFDPQQIVLARELSLREIEACAKATTKPIEVFCHGALCVAYSGQCLTSESLGQRSANRGECAQACRMPYRLEVDGRMRDLGERRYVFSPQDLCALERVPELLAAGVKSFKIEGRLKSPEYVAATTRAYRRALDAALAQKTPSPARQRADLYAMQMSFSRGFSTGWLDGTDHPLLTHGRFGKKRGALAGRIVRSGEGWVELEGMPPMPVAPGDGFVIDAGQDRNEEQGGRIWKVQGNRLFFHGKGSHIDWRRVRPGHLLWKTADPALDKALHATWCNFAQRATEAAGQPLSIRFAGRMGGQLTAECRGIVVGSGQPLEPAEKRPLTPEVLSAQFGRLGGTGYTLGACEYALEEGLMMPLSVLNRMRRELVEALDARGESAPAERREPLLWNAWQGSFPAPTAAEGYNLSVLCREPGQALAAAAAGVKRVYLDFKDLKQLAPVAEQIRAEYPGVAVWVATLRIMKPHEAGYFKFLVAAKPDGVLVRNLGAALWWRDKGVPMVGDFSLNTANPESVLRWRAFGLKTLTVSYDLNARQLADMLRSGCGPQLELTLHQHIPMFHTEHCVYCTFLSRGHSFKDCGQPCEHHRVRVMDRTHAMHYLRSDEGCRNTLFNGQAQTAARYVEGMRRWGLSRFRLELLEESPEQTTQLISLYRDMLRGRLKPESLMQQLNLLDRIGVTEGTMA